MSENESSTAAAPKKRPATRNSNIDIAGAPAEKSKSKPSARKAAARKQARAGKAANIAFDEDAAARALFAAVLKTDIGDGMVTSAQAEKMVIGLPLPGLALRLVFQQDIIPLGRNLMLVGLPGACKSALLAELYRWVLSCRGMACHIETENKDSPDLRNSICRHDQRLIERLFYKPANSQEQWMEALIGWIKTANKQFAKVQDAKRLKPKKGERAAEFRERTGPKVNDANPGWVCPLIFGVDSLTAVSSDATIEGIKSTGHAERSWPIEAGLLSSFVKVLANLMRNKPFILASTNHLKPGQDPTTQAPIDNIPGGKSIRYMNTTELKVVKKIPIKNAEYEGNRIEITCLKNSLGTTGYRAVVDVKWWWEVDEATGKLRQQTFWDWDTASIDCLLAQKAVSARRWKEINEVVDIHVPDSGVKTFWSKALGIPQASPVTLREAGAILETRPDLLDELYKVLHITTRSKFVTGTDYTDLEAVLRRAAQAMDPVYSPLELSEVGARTNELFDEEMAATLAAAEKRKAAKAVLAAREADDDDDDDDDDE